METVKGYLLTIAKNLYFKRQLDAARHVGLTQEHPDPTPGPDRITEDRQELERVVSELQHLSDVDRAALLMRVSEGLPYEEIGRSLGLSLSAVKVKVHRARLRLHATRIGKGAHRS